MPMICTDCVRHGYNPSADECMYYVYIHRRDFVGKEAVRGMILTNGYHVGCSGRK